MPRPGYRSISISEDLYELIDSLRRKYNMSAIDLIKTALEFFDEVVEKVEKIGIKSKRRS